MRLKVQKDLVESSRACPGGLWGKGAWGCPCSPQWLLPGHGWLFLQVVCGPAMFDGLVMWLTFNSEPAWKRKAFLFGRWCEGRAEERGKTRPGGKCRSGTDHTFSLFRNHPRCASSFSGKWNFSSLTICLSCSVCKGCCMQLSSPRRFCYYVRQAMEQKEEFW